MIQDSIRNFGGRFAIWPRKPERLHEPPISVLAPYQPLTRSVLKRFFGFAGLMLFCFVYGFFFSVLAPGFFAFILFAPIYGSLH